VTESSGRGNPILSLAIFSAGREFSVNLAATVAFG